MDNLDQREILSRVASGTLTPEEAVEQLARARSAPSISPISRVRIIRRLGSTDVIGDPTVREAVADGPHRARIDGDTLIIEGDFADAAGFVFGGGPGHRPDGRDGDRMTVRVNPDLALELEVQAGACRVSGVGGPMRADVQAGSIKIDGFKGPLQASVQAGSLKASGVLSAGASRIACEAGSVSVHLERGSSVRVSAHSTLGKVTLPGGIGSVSGRGPAEVTIGSGVATLHVESTMGSVMVSAES